MGPALAVKAPEIRTSWLPLANLEESIERGQHDRQQGASVGLGSHASSAQAEQARCRSAYPALANNNMGNTLAALNRVRTNSSTLKFLARRSISTTAAASSPKSRITRSPKKSKDGFPLAILEQHTECRKLVDSLIQERTRLQNIEQRSLFQENDLASVTERLQIAKLALDDYTKLIIKSATLQGSDSKVFTSADRKFIEKVTGTSLDWCKWYVMDEVNTGPYANVFPSQSFQVLFEQNSQVFSMFKEAGRRTVLDLFFRDVLSREEFSSALRVFPEYEFCLTSTDGSRPIRLSGKADYTIGHSSGNDLFDIEPSKELHLIAAEAK